MDKTVVITGTQEAVDKAGRASEIAYQIAKKAKELKRDMEAQLTTNNAEVAGNASTAREMGSLGACLLYTSPSPRDATLSRMPSSA